MSVITLIENSHQKKTDSGQCSDQHWKNKHLLSGSDSGCVTLQKHWRAQADERLRFPSDLIRVDSQDEAASTRKEDIVSQNCVHSDVSKSTTHTWFWMDLQGCYIISSLTLQITHSSAFIMVLGSRFGTVLCVLCSVKTGHLWNNNIIRTNKLQATRWCLAHLVFDQH